MNFLKKIKGVKIRFILEYQENCTVIIHPLHKQKLKLLFQKFQSFLRKE